MRLADYLAEEKISPADFSRLIDVSPASVSRYAAGLRFPEPAILQRIKDATDGKVTPNDFLADSESRTSEPERATP